MLLSGHPIDKTIKNRSKQGRYQALASVYARSSSARVQVIDKHMRLSLIQYAGGPEVAAGAARLRAAPHEEVREVEEV